MEGRRGDINIRNLEDAREFAIDQPTGTIFIVSGFVGCHGLLAVSDDGRTARRIVTAISAAQRADPGDR
jgi:hypothetical protein